MANNQNLISLANRTPEKRNEIATKGGYATKGIKRLTLRKCTRCELGGCPLREQGIKEDWRCKLPDVKRAILEAYANPEKWFESIAGDIIECQALAKNFTEKKDLAKLKSEIKEKFLPTAQTINVNQTVVNFKDVVSEYKQRGHGSSEGSDKERLDRADS